MIGDFRESCFYAALLPRPRFLYLAKGWQWHVLQGLQKERKRYYLMLWISFNVFTAITDTVRSNSMWTTYLPWLNTDVSLLPRFSLFPTFPVFSFVSSEWRTGVEIVPGITWKSDHKEFQIGCSTSHLSLFLVLLIDWVYDWNDSVLPKFYMICFHIYGIEEAAVT